MSAWIDHDPANGRPQNLPDFVDISLRDGRMHANVWAIGAHWGELGEHTIVQYRPSRVHDSEDKTWAEAEERMDVIGQNGNTGEHYEAQPDMVNHPPHYTAHPSGVECIQITEHMGFCLGNAMKYLWRADLKNGLEDLQKAKWYIEREIAKREAGK